MQKLQFLANILKVKVSDSRYPRYTCSSDFTSPGSGCLRQPAARDPTLVPCTRYPLWLGGPRLCGIRRLSDTSTRGQQWESNSRPSDLESNALSTWPHAPTFYIVVVNAFCEISLTVVIGYQNMFNFFVSDLHKQPTNINVEEYPSSW